MGASGATEKIPGGLEVTVSCAEGDTGFVYPSALPFRVEKLTLTELSRPRTRIQMNLGDPDNAFSLSFLPNDGVGLARLEFIINNTIRVHPMALLHPERVGDPEALSAIEELCAGYEDKAEYFIDRLAQVAGLLAFLSRTPPAVIRLFL